jgi:hypothetical protein
MKLRILRKLPKEKLQKIVLICVLSIIAVVGVIQFYVLGNWTALADTRAQIAKLDDQIHQAESKARDARQDVAYRADVKSFVETQRAAMISGDPFAWVVREISLLAEQHPVRINALNAGAKGESVGSLKGETYTTRIDVSAAYDQIGEFVRDLENRFPTAQIRSLTVAGNANDKGEHSAVLDLVLRLQPTEPARKAEAKKKT